MKKILSILICVLLGVTAVWAGEAKMTASVSALSTGSGEVAVSQSNSMPTSGWSTIPVEGSNSGLLQKKYMYAFARTSDTSASEFSHWIVTSSNNVTNTSNPISVQSGRTGTTSMTVEAVFYKVFDKWSHTEISIQKKSGVPPIATVTANVFKASNVAINIEKKEGPGTANISCTHNINGDGYQTATFTITAGDGVEAGDVFEITFSGSKGAKHTVVVKIFSEIKFTLAAPTIGIGAYSYTRSDGQGNSGTLNLGDNYVSITKEGNEWYELKAIETDASYRFNRWKIKHAKGEPTYKYINPYPYDIVSGDTITAEFIEDRYAMFIIKGREGEFYNDLNEAIRATGGNGVIVVYQSGFLASGNYNIDNDITLLVPGDDAYTVSKGDVTIADFMEGATRTAIKCKKYLTMEDNTTITVKNGGAISVYAKMSKIQPMNGTPYSYGRMDMGKNCHITIESGGVLSALGYITGNPETSSITAKAGALVYESFQITDWRGGNATVGMVGVDLSNLGALAGALVGGVFNSPGNDYDVFPAGQYFVQNIETKLILEYEAIEKLVTGVGLGSRFGDFCANAAFVVPDNSTYSSGSGFFKMGQGTKLIKYYDRTEDRQKFIIEGTPGAGSKARVDKIELVFPGISITMVFTINFDMKISSSTFVLPVNNNMDVSITNTAVTASSRLAFMAGSTLSLDENSEFIVSQSQYLYDKDQNSYSGTDANGNPITIGYFGTGNSVVKTVPYTPGNTEYVNDTYSSTALKKRTAENLTDARWLINGKVTINGGGVYTTSSGADITSDGNGKVYFGVKGTEAKTYQAYQDGNEISGWPEIAITNAQLHNDEVKNPTQPYSAGANVDANANPKETYTYIKSLGMWSLPQSLQISKVVGDSIVITLPKDTIQNVLCYVDTDNKNVTENNFVVELASNDFFTLSGNIVYDKTNEILTIPVKYTHKNIHNVGNPYTQQLVVKCKDLTSGAILHTEEIDLIAIEDYKPKFSVSIDGALYMGDSILMSSNTYVNATTSKSVVITAESDNVAKTLTAWTKTNENPFDFVFGAQTEQPFAAAQLTYTPTINGEHKGSVSITATYTDGTGHKEDSTVVIKLKANAILNANDLKFAQFSQPIYTTTDAFELIDNATKNNTKDIDVTLSKTGIVNITGTGTVDNPYKVTPLAVGVVTITATQAASGSVHGKTISTTITVLDGNSYPVPFCINEESGISEFNKRLYGGTSVSFNETNSTVEFNSTSSASEWIFRFNGTPDKLTFTPTGTNSWNVQQRSSETAEWKNIVSWTSLPSGVPVTYQLEPTTCQIRIQYGSANAEIGTLADVCVSKLQISASVNKLYIPIHADSTVERTFVLTHTQGAVPTIALESGLAYSAEISDNLGTAGAPYYKTTVKVATTTNTTEKEYTLTATEDGTTVEVIVSAYTFPQELPIKLATDAPANGDRYYFVTSASSNVQWDAINRQVVFQNPGGYDVRSVTFAFNGAPSIISFDAYSADGAEMIVDSVWTIYESADGVNFYPATLSRDSEETNTLVQALHYTTRYIRVNYSSVYTREIRLSNLVIEGYPSVLVNPQNIHFTTDETDLNPQKLEAIAINLQEVDFIIDNTSAFQISMDTTYATFDWHNAVTATETTHESALGKNKVDTIFLGVKWLKKSALDEGKITIRNKKDNSVLAVVPLMGSEGYLTKDKADNSGIYTGIPDGNTYHGAEYKDYSHHQVNLTNAFDRDGIAMFDYLFIYGETTPASGTNITPPGKGSANASTNVGSNAVTPFYVYRKAQNSESQYKGYQFVGKIDNANTAEKSLVSGIVVADDSAGVVHIDATNSLRVYMTGFCPYATTGYTKNQEGVFLFRGKHGAKLDLYLEDFHVFSRNKTEKGNGFYGDKEGGEIFTDSYARGSGGVLVFENVDPQEQLQNYLPFEVSIHTIGDNLLSSNYGCFFGLSIVSDGPVGMKAYQVSSPIHIHMFNKEYVRKTKTRLNFDDVWPTAVDADNVITDSIRTNGFLALKKQANNAPSIDMGNKHTEVNFKGGQVELQNSQIGSDTYKTTLAISHRSGYFGSDDAGIQLCYGIGTDSVGGTVNFIDGTVTVRPMYVAPSYRQYYLMDTLADGTMSDSTYCLRTPKNTYIRGGSVCRVRACQHVTSKGGAPKDRETGKFLGQYVYTLRGNDVLNTTTKLAHIVEFPSNVEGLLLHHQNSGYTYGLNSVTPDKKNQFYFWIPDGMGGVTAEVDKYMSIWKACMTEIGAGIPGIEGRVGGDTPIEENEEVKYLMYCQIDKNIWDVITAGPKVGDKTDYTYQPPFEVPVPAKTLFNNETYARYDLLTYVSDSLQYQVTSDTAYTITDRVYYVTTATADVWQTFTAPFNVENIYVVESYSEAALEQIGNGNRTDILREQATHNADFAAFFAVAMAMGSDKDFDGIYQSYKKWAYTEDKKSDLYKGNEADYNLRSMQELVPYIGKNWRDANFYLNHNAGNWVLTDEESYEVQWEMLTASDTTDGILLHKGETYSLMFPYCPSCETSLEGRDYWDYWSGKFLIFESTAGKQVINGRDFLNDTIEGNVFTQIPDVNEVIVTGNSTFAQLEPERDNVYVYNSNAPFMNSETFEPKEFVTDPTIYPTTAFLYGYVPTNNQGMPARGVKRSGEIIYDKENTPTDNNLGGNIPTVGGGNDLFITSTVEGINIAVAEPQQVRVMSATGAIIFSGMVQTAVDVLLPTAGVYVITGENEVHKILH